MLSALGVVLLYVGSFIEVFDISMAVIASLMCVLALIEYGKGESWLVFAVTAVLSLVLLPQKAPAVMYACFFGFYPILKERYEKKKPPLAWALKELTFNVALVLIFLLLRPLLIGTADVPVWMYAVAIALCEAVFVLYDIALTRLISFYIYKLRSRLKLK